VIDTNHFKGNHPPEASIEACEADPGASAEWLAGPDAPWRTLMPKSALDAHAENVFSVNSPGRCTHVRLNIFPDGGVARLRMLGVVAPDWERILKSAEPIDLVAVEHGGRALACSDEFFSSPSNLIMPGQSRSMGDGWETKRRRGPGHDWAVLQLGRRGTIERIEVDTNHFKGNYPATCSVEVCDAEGATVAEFTGGAAEWREVLPSAALGPHAKHTFESEILDGGPATHARLNIYPDGGVSRLRLFGRVAGS
jgi:allantoicase